MDKKEYINKLKKTELRPQKVKVNEKKEEILLEQTPRDMGDVHAEIIGFLQQNPKPSDDQVHAFADSIGMDKHEFEEHIYMILGDILTEGRSKGFKGTYDPEQIKMGIKVEYEHTTIPEVAEKIAKDHLAELPDYYTRLAKMESDAGVDH